MKFFRKLFQPPSALSIAVEELEEAKRQSLQAEASREYYYGLSVVLKNRIARLATTVRELSQEARNGDQDT